MNRSPPLLSLFSHDSLLKMFHSSRQSSSSRLTRGQKDQITTDTLDRTESIIKSHAPKGATQDSTFYHEQIASLDSTQSPNYRNNSLIEVVNSDAYTVALNLLKENNDANGKVAVLNLASDIRRAGGWTATLSETQEEALCYSSTLYITLKDSYYPWANVGPGSAAGVFSPGVVIFKRDLSQRCEDLPIDQRRIVSVITVAAPRAPKLTADREGFANASILGDLREKIRLVYRMAATNGQHYVILGAMGCGAYRCPPRIVAREMKEILLSDEFRGWFKKVIFAVLEPSGDESGDSNFGVFRDAFKGVKLG